MTARPHRTDRHAALAWADETQARHLAAQRAPTWAQLHAAMRTHQAHDAGCLADIGDADAPDYGAHAECGSFAAWSLVAAIAIVGAAALSAIFPWGFALPLP